MTQLVGVAVLVDAAAVLQAQGVAVVQVGVADVAEQDGVVE
jgi:hypothetical protein